MASLAGRDFAHAIQLEQPLMLMGLLCFRERVAKWHTVGNMTDYQRCPQCESNLDEMMRAPEVKDE